jgi:hypothetical protein
MHAKRPEDSCIHFGAGTAVQLDLFCSATCRKATANQFRLLIHTAAYWLMLSLRGLAPRASFWRDAQFDTIRLCQIKVAGRVTEMVTRIKIALPTAFPHQAGFANLADRIAKLAP